MGHIVIYLLITTCCLQDLDELIHIDFIGLRVTEFIENRFDLLLLLNLVEL